MAITIKYTIYCDYPGCDATTAEVHRLVTPEAPKPNPNMVGYIRVDANIFCLNHVIKVDDFKYYEIRDRGL